MVRQIVGMSTASSSIAALPPRTAFEASCRVLRCGCHNCGVDRQSCKCYSVVNQVAVQERRPSAIFRTNECKTCVTTTAACVLLQLLSPRLTCNGGPAILARCSVGAAIRLTEVTHFARAVRLARRVQRALRARRRDAQHWLGRGRRTGAVLRSSAPARITPHCRDCSHRHTTRVREQPRRRRLARSAAGTATHGRCCWSPCR